MPTRRNRATAISTRRNRATATATPPRRILFSADDFLLLGLSYFFAEDVTANTCRKTNLERFRKHYGCSPTVCNKIFADVQTEGIETKPNPKCLLLALFYLKVHPKDSVLAGPFQVIEKTALLQAKQCVKKTSALKEMKWDFDASTEETHIVSVDGVHCRTYEPRTEPSAGWHSKKFNKAGLSYELGIAIYKNQLCWINGPFPAGQNDLGIFKKPNGLRSKIPLGKLVVADQGCVDKEIDHIVAQSNFKAGARAVVAAAATGAGVFHANGAQEAPAPLLEETSLQRIISGE